ncbi:MAG: hypothetical protein AAGA10_24850 [Bacteroidota bacterium]
MSTAIQEQNKLASLHQFNCQNCGNALSVQNPRAKYIVCQYCGSQLDAQSDTHQVLKKLLANPEKHPPFSFIKLGQKASFQGIDYQVIARTRWRMDYMEYWSDEDGSGYSKEIWVYDEWLLLSEYYTYFYLVEDRSGFSVVEEIVPETPMLRPKDKRMKFYKGQNKHRIQEYGKANVIFFEGESNYQINKGDEIQFSMYKSRGIEYLAEWRLDPTKKYTKEIEFFKETPISKARLLEAFAANPSVLDVKKRFEHWGFVKKLGIWATALMGVLLLYATISGAEIFQQSIPIAQTLDREVLSLPVEVPDAGLYRLKLGASGLSNEQEVYVFAYILDKDSTAINVVDTDFYYYTGVDDEGRWTEKDVGSSEVFRIENPGTYYIQLYTNQDRISQQGTITVSLLKGIWLKRYFIFGLIAFICIAIGAYVKQHYS